MALHTTFETIQTADLLALAEKKRDEGYRFVQMLCVNTEQGIDALYACGPLSRHAAEAFGEGGRWFETRDALIEALKGLRGTATVKASHFMGFAAVVRALQDNEE